MSIKAILKRFNDTSTPPVKGVELACAGGVAFEILAKGNAGMSNED
jgi:hypothetical protein